jgi:hypothetical protein
MKARFVLVTDGEVLVKHGGCDPVKTGPQRPPKAALPGFPQTPPPLFDRPCRQKVPDVHKKAVGFWFREPTLNPGCNPGKQKLFFFVHHLCAGCSPLEVSSSDTSSPFKGLRRIAGLGMIQQIIHSNSPYEQNTRQSACRA